MEKIEEKNIIVDHYPGKMKELIRLSILARNAGTTYGKYVAKNLPNKEFPNG